MNVCIVDFILCEYYIIYIYVCDVQCIILTSVNNGSDDDAAHERTLVAK